MNTNSNRWHNLTKRSPSIGIMIILLLVTALVSGSGVYLWKDAQLKELERHLSEQSSEGPKTIIRKTTPSPLISEYREQIAQLMKAKWELKKNFIQSRLAYLNITEPDSNSFIIFGHYSEAPYFEYDSIVKLPKGLSLNETLQILADSLSTRSFSNLPIKVVRIDTSFIQLSTLIVDLSEAEDSTEANKSWRNHYFQGSAGGASTTNTLIQTFLQKTYQGDWIDAVKFTYNGKPIFEADWDHIGELSNVIDR